MVKRVGSPGQDMKPKIRTRLFEFACIVVMSGGLGCATPCLPIPPQGALSHSAHRPLLGRDPSPTAFKSGQFRVPTIPGGASFAVVSA